MGKKRKGNGLALNQCCRKKKKRCGNAINHNDNTSTIAYSNDKAKSNESSTLPYEDYRSQFTADRELVNILDKISQISDEMIQDISMDYSMDDYIHFLNNTNNVKMDENEKKTVESAESDAHDINACSCHVPEHLQYAIYLIQSQDKLIPVIKQMYNAKILDNFLLLLQLIADGTLEADDIPLLLAVEQAKL